MRGLYVHVPFCEKRCHYCDFNTYLLREGGVDQYLEALAQEAALYAARDDVAGVEFDTLYIGGGTPTALGPAQLERLFAALAPLRLWPGAEVTVEANPGTLTDARLAVLRAWGVNRISLGVQSLNDELLARLGRIHTARHAADCYRRARRAGFTNINVDLMFGLPGQDLADWQRTLQEVIAWGPEHISCYSLIIEEGTFFGELHAQNALPLPGEEAELAMFRYAMDALGEAGYDHYEISNWARPGYASQHNRIYWLNGEWLGLGPGAHSQWRGERFANERLPQVYAERLRGGQLPVAWRETVDQATAEEDTVILGLRLRDGVDADAFARRFGKSLDEVFAREIARLLELGLVEWRGSRLRLTDKGLPVANQAFQAFLRERV